MKTLSVAPMMDWTDRHCRYFHRLLSRDARLYTEMITTGALIHGDVERHLRFNEEEHPVALQLGGSEPVDLAHCARLAQQRGYDEVNLNCGCPSERVRRGSFGACLMAEPALVADCVKAMADAVALPVTVKHRTGIDQVESYEFLRDFVGTVSEAGCRTFIVHARNAWLKGLSPKQNREVPPLRYDFVHRLKRDFPQLEIVVNGGITTTQHVREQLQELDGVMVGREAYHNPWWLTQWDAMLGASTSSARTVGGASTGSARTERGAWASSGRTESRGAQSVPVRPELVEGLAANSRESVELAMTDYMARESKAHGTSWSAIARHMLGLRNGLPGARRWRQVWSDHTLKDMHPRDVMALAHEAVAQAA